MYSHGINIPKYSHRSQIELRPSVGELVCNMLDTSNSQCDHTICSTSCSCLKSWL